MKLYLYIAALLSMTSSCLAMTPVTITNPPFSVELQVQPICGQAAPNDTVTISIFNGLVIGTVTADENGLWTYVAPSAPFVFSATAYDINNTGTPATNPQLLQATVTSVDGTCNGTSLTIPSISTTEAFYQISIAGTSTFSGTAPAGQIVQLNINGTLLPYILLNVDESGIWSLDLSANGGFNTTIVAAGTDGTSATARLSMGLNVVPLGDPAAAQMAESAIAAAINTKFCPNVTL